MNKAYKVVFNKLRGTMMVVNEATSSIQKKGAKTVIASAAVAMLSSVSNTALAADLTVPTKITASPAAALTEKVTVAITGDQGTFDTIASGYQVDGRNNTAQRPVKVELNGGLDVQASVRNITEKGDDWNGVRVTNSELYVTNGLDINVSATGPNAGGNSGLKGIYLHTVNGNDPRTVADFSGNINITVDVKQPIKEDGSHYVYNSNHNGNEQGHEYVPLEAKGIEVHITSPANNTPSNLLKFSGDILRMNVTNDGNTSLGMNISYASTGQSTINVESKKFQLVVEGVKRSDFEDLNWSGTPITTARAPAIGLQSEGGTINILGDLDATVKDATAYTGSYTPAANGRVDVAVGVYATDVSKTGSAGPNEADAKITFEGNVDLKVIGAVGTESIGVYTNKTSTSTPKNVDVIFGKEDLTDSNKIYQIKADRAFVGNGTITLNNGTLLLTGTVDEFTGNFVQNGGALSLTRANSYFGGDVTVNGGTLTLGGVGPASNKTLLVKNGATLAITDTIVNNGTVKLETGSTVAVLLGDAALSTPTVTLIENVDEGKIESQEGVKLAQNGIYDISWYEGTPDSGKISVKTKSAEQILSDINVSEQQAGTVAAVLPTIMNSGSAPASSPIGQIAKVLGTFLESTNSEAVAQIAEDLAPSTAPVVSSVSQGVNNAIAGVANARMAANRAAGDVFTGGSAWAQMIYNSADQDATKKTAELESDTYGITVGVDGKIGDNLTIGAGFGVTKTDAESGTRDIDVDSYSLFGYTEYNADNGWFVNGMATAIRGRYEENKVPAGIKLTAKYQTTVLGAGVATGYHFENGISPEVGLRYLRTHQGSYNDGAQKIHTDGTNLLTASLGAKYEKAFEQGDWLIKPTAHVAATYDVVSDDTESAIRVIGGGQYHIISAHQKRAAYEAGLGLEASNGDWDFSVAYNGEFRSHFKSHTGMIKAKYNF